MKLKKAHFLLLAILAVSFLLRFYRLDQNLPEIYADETSHYIHLIEFSIYRRIFSFTWFLGLNPLGVRAAAALYSSFIPLAIFLACSPSFQNQDSSPYRRPLKRLPTLDLSHWSYWPYPHPLTGHHQYSLAYFFLGKSKSKLPPLSFSS